jgi:hypothetical protein
MLNARIRARNPTFPQLDIKPPFLAHSLSLSTRYFKPEPKDEVQGELVTPKES